MVNFKPSLYINSNLDKGKFLFQVWVYIKDLLVYYKPPMLVKYNRYHNKVFMELTLKIFMQININNPIKTFSYNNL